MANYTYTNENSQVSAEEIMIIQKLLERGDVIQSTDEGVVLSIPVLNEEMDFLCSFGSELDDLEAETVELNGDEGDYNPTIEC